MTGEQSKTALRNAKRKGRYKVQFARTEVNQKRRLRRHLRAHPGDAVAVRVYEFTRKYGAVAPIGLSSKGKKRAARIAHDERRGV